MIRIETFPYRYGVSVFLHENFFPGVWKFNRTVGMGYLEEEAATIYLRKKPSDYRKAAESYAAEAYYFADADSMEKDPDNFDYYGGLSRHALYGAIYCFEQIDDCIPDAKRICNSLFDEAQSLIGSRLFTKEVNADYPVVYAPAFYYIGHLAKKEKQYDAALDAYAIGLRLSKGVDGWETWSEDLDAYAALLEQTGNSNRADYVRTIAAESRENKKISLLNFDVEKAIGPDRIVAYLAPSKEFGDGRLSDYLNKLEIELEKHSIVKSLKSKLRFSCWVDERGRLSRFQGVDREISVFKTLGSVKDLPIPPQNPMKLQIVLSPKPAETEVSLYKFIDWAPFLARLDKIVKVNWHPSIPRPTRRGTTIAFRVSRFGQISAATVEETSADEELDLAALRAFELGKKYAGQPPDGCSKSTKLFLSFDKELPSK